jgi:hypothetical protein
MKWIGFIFCLVSGQIVFAQNMIWEKKFGWIRFDQLYDGVLASPGSVIAVGTSTQFGVIINGNLNNGLIALKINVETGDTVWLKGLNQYCYPPKCILGDNHLVYIAASESTSPNRLRLTIIDTNGTVFYRTTLDSTGEAPSVEKLIRTNDGNFLLIGTRSGIGPTPSNDMYAIKFDWLGNVLWNRSFNANPNSGGNHVEENAYNQYLLSGNAGSKIWRIKLDSAGNELENSFLYQTPSLVNFDENSSVLLTPDSAYSVSGNLSGSGQNYYFGKHKQGTNFILWGGEQPGYMAKPLVNRDKSLIQYRANNVIFHLNRLNEDSAVIWTSDLSNRLGSRSVILNKFIYLEDESAIALGFLFYLTGISNEFYFCRISNVGIPYDPSVTVSTRSKVKAESLVPYPNPVTSSLVFKGLKEEGVLFLYDLKGQMVKEMSIKPYQRVYLSGLAKGLYLYRIQVSDGGYYSGKLVKEGQ